MKKEPCSFNDGITRSSFKLVSCLFFWKKDCYITLKYLSKFTLHCGRKQFLMKIFFLSSNFVQYKNFLHWDKEIRDGKEGIIVDRITRGLNNKYCIY